MKFGFGKRIAGFVLAAAVAAGMQATALRSSRREAQRAV